jgi:hypothetical protein
MTRDVTEHNGKFVIRQCALMSGCAQRPRRDGRVRSVRRDARQCLMQCIGCSVRQQAILKQQVTNCIHPLSSAANNASLPASCAPGCALWFSRFVNQGRIKAANTSGNDVPGAFACFNDSPAT